MTPPVGRSRASRSTDRQVTTVYAGGRAHAVWESTGKGKANRRRATDHRFRRDPQQLTSPELITDATELKGVSFRIADLERLRISLSGWADPAQKSRIWAQESGRCYASWHNMTFCTTASLTRSAGVYWFLHLAAASAPR